MLKAIWRLGFLGYLAMLSWQLLTPVTIITAGSWDKLYHMVSFAVLAGLAILAWRNYSTRTIAIALIGYAALTEILQHFIPGRSFSILDWLADGLGVVIATLITMYLLKHLRFLDTNYS